MCDVVNVLIHCGVCNLVIHKLHKTVFFFLVVELFVSEIVHDLALPDL